MNPSSISSTISPVHESAQQKLSRLLAAARAVKAQEVATNTALLANLAVTSPMIGSANNLNTLLNNTTAKALDKYGNEITYNEQQLRFIELATTGKSCILIGAAGTGKTTCQRGAVTSIIQSGHAGILQSDGHKILRDGTPGIVICSFTRRAVANIKRAISDDMKNNCLTIHALLEYEPVYYEQYDAELGKDVKTMRFEPTRNSMRPLPSSINVCIIEESSMVSTELFQELKDALPPNCQFIFLGDIQQLPPVFGSAILGYKLLELPTVELTTVYRQALESPIIRLAHRILSGKPLPASEFNEWNTPNQLTLHPWKKKLDPENAVNTMAKFLTTAIDNKLYDPLDDMVLIPFNKACGTIELNRKIANHLARKNGLETHEIIAGFNKHYLSVGDKVLYDKEDAVITGIAINGNYSGARFQPASTMLDYWGYLHSPNSPNGTDETHTIESDEDDDIDFLLSQSVALGDGEEGDRVRQASHTITVRLNDTGHSLSIETASGINNLLLAYALTVHKAQGSEFRKVFLLLHQSHATMIQRELLYTAVTRAKEELYVICEPEHFIKGILNQRIKGNTLAEKAEYFKGKITNGNDITSKEKLI
jgi:exodeoxyribonuclease V alpha subunit